MNEQPVTLRDTARGLGLRAAILGVGGLLIGGWLTASAMKAAGKLMQVMVGAILVLIGGGFATWEVRKFRGRMNRRELAA